MKRLFSLILILIVSSAPVFADDLQDGRDAYKRGDFRTAYLKWKLLAEGGNAEAQLNLGVMYANGEGVPKDNKEAAKWFLIAGAYGLFAPAMQMTPDQIAEAQKLAREWVAVKQRFLYFNFDRNLDGRFTISDVGLLAKWIFFYPGDWLLNLVMTKFELLAIFLEVSEENYGGWGAGIMSFILWIILFITPWVLIPIMVVLWKMLVGEITLEK